ncbi:MAG: hypothetical protein WD059_07740 [Balneolaceae bacterium]
MNDTTKKAHEKQLEIIMFKTPSERAMMGIEMTDSIYRLVRNTIKKENPGLDEREVTAELFLRYYRNEFSEKEKQRITTHLKSR